MYVIKKRNKTVKGSITSCLIGKQHGYEKVNVQGKL